MDLPAAPFDACDQASGQVNSQALVRYKTDDYPVPVAYVAFVARRRPTDGAAALGPLRPRYQGYSSNRL